jgi:hypothetical protein
MQDSCKEIWSADLPVMEVEVEVEEEQRICDGQGSQQQRPYYMQAELSF